MCIFCKIINKEIPSDFVYEDDDLIIIKDINPAADIHLLAIPKKHIASINDVKESDEKLIGKIFTKISKVGKDLGFADDGYKVIVNVGKGGGQAIFHVHFHILSGNIKRFDF